jgi:hypothetical protein
MKTPTINMDEMLKSMAAEAVKQHKQANQQRGAQGHRRR